MRTRDDSAKVLLNNQNNLKNQPTLAGYIPSTMAPENSPFQNGVPTTASAPLTESALRQLQQAQAEEAQKQSLQQLQHFRGGAPPEHSPPVQSPIPPGSPDALVSNAGGAGNAVHVGGLHNSNSLSQASPFAFAAQQQQYQNQYPSRDVSGGSHVSHAGTQQQSHQQHALADAAVSAQRVANQKVLEQQHAAAVASQAATTVAGTSPTDVANQTQAALNAVQAQSVYEMASQDAINAQSRATQLQQAALTASLQPSAGNLAATTAAAAGVTLPQMQQQQWPSVAAIQPPPVVQAAATVPPLQPSPLAQAAVAAKQAAAQKQIESQAAASVYQNAAVQAASAIEPSHVAVANAVAQQAALMYQTAANEAVSAAATAAQWEQAAASVATSMTVPPTPLPASVPLAAQIAAGATLQQTQPNFSHAMLLAGQQHVAGLGALPSPALTAALGASSVPAQVPLPGAAAAAAAAQQLQQMQLLQATTGMNFQTPYLGITPNITASTLAGLSGNAGAVGSNPSGLFVTPSTVVNPSSVFGTSLADTLAQSSLSSGIQSLGISEQQRPVPAPAPALQVTTARAAAAAPPQQQQQQPPSPPPTVVKAVCSSGGSFIRGSGGAWDYEGGETRLINIPYGCSAEMLFATLERATSSLSESSELTSEYNPTLKYRLPSDPNVWVDLVDDDDVEYMFDEWQEACMLGNQGSGAVGSGGFSGGNAASPTYAASTASAGSQTTSSACKLHLFVQWRRPISSLGSSSVEEAATADAATGEESGSRDSSGSRTTGSPEEASSNTTTRDPPSTAACGGDDDSAMQGKIQVVTPGSQENDGGKEEEGKTSGDKNNNTALVKPDSSARRHDRQRRIRKPSSNNNNPAGSKASQHHHHHNSSIDLPDLIERMEIIQPSDISLVKFLGSGGYGDVYLGRWHGCEVAVKCLNPALFFQGGAGGDPGAINRAAVTDLIKEADMLGSLRHPNVVWVYGMVLPSSSKSNKNSEDVAEYEGCTASEGDSDGDDTNGTNSQQKRKDRQRNIIDVIQAEAGTPSMMPGILRPPALVTEYMAGGSLKVALARKADIVAGPLTRIVLALDAAKGVEYLHSKRLVHFDLKSGNLLLGYRDRRPICKVADFGLAREKAQTFVSGVTSQRGTLPWIAPEILRTPDAVTEAADVYSFAIVMWELWTGREPWENTNFHALMLQLANPELKLRPPIPGAEEWDGPEGSAPPELAPGWRQLMERCWEEDPNNRPPFTQIVKELRGMISAIRPPRGGRGEGIGSGNGIREARGG